MRTTRVALAAVTLTLTLIVFSEPKASPKALAAAQQAPGSWIDVSIPETYTLKSIAMSSITDGWIVGSEGFDALGDPVGSVILHWNGSSWSRVASPDNTALYSVATVSANNAWAGGGSDGIFPKILHWNGSAWSDAVIPSMTGVINSIAMRTASDGWAVGGSDNCQIPNGSYEGTILHWNGTAWSVASGLPDILLNSVAALSADDVWVAGSYCHNVSVLHTDYGAVLGHWDGSVWHMDIRTPAPYGFVSIAALSSNDVWVTSNGGTIVHWDGHQWNNVSSPTSDTLMSVVMASPTDGWAVGGDQIFGQHQPVVLHWDGNTWETAITPASHRLLGAKTLSENECWAVGEEGQILHYTNFSRLFLPLLTR
jgi:photosystem II stability/assembly factor-like uncharacterized protein